PATWPPGGPRVRRGLPPRARRGSRQGAQGGGGVVGGHEGLRRATVPPLGRRSGVRRARRYERRAPSHEELPVTVASRTLQNGPEPSRRSGRTREHPRSARPPPKGGPPCAIGRAPPHGGARLRPKAQRKRAHPRGDPGRLALAPTKGPPPDVPR